MLTSHGRISGAALFLCAALSAASAWALSSDTPHRTVHIRGSVTFGHIVQSLAEQYMRKNPSSAVVVSGGGTSRGYLTLLDGTTDLAMVSGAPSRRPKMKSSEAA